MPTETWLDILATAGAVVFATLVGLTLFRYLKPADLQGGFDPCNGNWHEGEVVGCSTLSHIPQQPLNTHSNLAYLAAGLYMYFFLETEPAFVFAVTMTYLCIGSALYHATSTKWSGMLDVTGIFTVYTGLLVYAVAAVAGVGTAHVTPMLMFVVAGLSAFLLSRRYARNMRMVIAIGLGGTFAALLVHMFLRGDWSSLRYVLISLVLLAGAYAAWMLDRARKLGPYPWGHGAWHLLTAVGSAVALYAVHFATAPCPPPPAPGDGPGARTAACESPAGGVTSRPGAALPPVSEAHPQVPAKHTT
jgi:predicted membrane channel-forming protein YqfA (hemolysin III family)